MEALIGEEISDEGDFLIKNRELENLTGANKFSPTLSRFQRSGAETVPDGDSTVSERGVVLDSDDSDDDKHQLLS